MDINKANKILEEKEVEKQEEADATKAIEEFKKLEAKDRAFEEKIRKQEEIKEWKKRIPVEFCKPVAKCWNCKKTVELDKSKAISVVDGYYRISECLNCKSFIVDNVILRGADTMDELLPYCLKMK